MIFFLPKNKLQMTEKLLKTRFAFIVTVKINEYKLNFPSGVKVQSVNLSLKVHSVVSGEGKMFTFHANPVVYSTPMLSMVLILPTRFCRSDSYVMLQK